MTEKQHIANDIVLRRGLDIWIKNWRKYAALHPEASEDQSWREQKYLEMVSLLNKRASLPNSITCPKCGKTSYNRHDIEEEYCNYCHQFHSRMQ